MGVANVGKKHGGRYVMSVDASVETPVVGQKCLTVETAPRKKGSGQFQF